MEVQMTPARGSLVLVLLGSVGLVGSPVRGAVQAPAPAAPLSQASRLQGRADCWAFGRSVAAFLKSSSAAAGVELTADQEAGDQKLILVSGSARLGQVLDLVKDHLALRWSALPPAPGGELPSGYRLVETK